MHPSTRRLFASVKSTASKYLEPNTPTGLTGLSTHPHPRPALIYTYKQTLQRLAQLPASSVYRQSTEALTKHRLAVIEAAKPEGYDEWLARVKKQIDDNPAAYARFRTEDGGFRGVVDRAVAEGTAWDGEFKRGVYQAEGPNRMEDAEKKARLWEGEVKMVEEEGVRGEVAKVEDLEREPGLTRDQYVFCLSVYSLSLLCVCVCGFVWVS